MTYSYGGTWQLSNPPILSLAAIKASLAIFADAKMDSFAGNPFDLRVFGVSAGSNILRCHPHHLHPAMWLNAVANFRFQVKNADKQLFDAISKEGNCRLARTRCDSRCSRAFIQYFHRRLPICPYS
ncbi:MAG: hypothetical protein R2795_02945 [Saprospiraceae bacterium]